MRYTQSFFALVALTALSACGSDAPTSTSVESSKPPAVTFEADESAAVIGKPSGPVTISYRIIGQPMVGQPLLIDLDIRSAFEGSPVELSYRIPDSTALAFPADQLDRVSLAAPQDERGMAHQISVIPQREGRLYLNVAADVATPDGSMSTVTAIPIQVGSAPRELQQNGTLIEDESGEQIRTLPARER